VFQVPLKMLQWQITFPPSLCCYNFPSLALNGFAWGGAEHPHTLLNEMQMQLITAPGLTRKIL
jgi:hypothetical protein